MAEMGSSPCSSAHVLSRRTRTCGNKVRTGCITCKARHVKCDEQTPACQRCISSGRICDGYVPVAPRRLHRHSRSVPEAKSRSHSPLPPTSSPGVFYSNDATQLEAYRISTVDPMFNFHGTDTASNLWEDPTFASQTPFDSMSSSYSSPSISDLDALDYGFDAMYLAPPQPIPQPRSSPSLSFTDSIAPPPILVLTSLDHAKCEFEAILQASAQTRAAYESIDQLTKHQHLSSRLHLFRSALENYELFNSAFYTSTELRAVKVLKTNVLSFYINLTRSLNNDNGYEIFEPEFEEIVRLCEELVADGVTGGELVAGLRQVAMYCRNRGVKRRAVLLLSFYSSN